MPGSVLNPDVKESTESQRLYWDNLHLTDGETGALQGWVICPHHKDSKWQSWALMEDCVTQEPDNLSQDEGAGERTGNRGHLWNVGVRGPHKERNQDTGAGQ